MSGQATGEYVPDVSFNGRQTEMDKECEGYAKVFQRK